jgi:hypothetical protein
MKRISAKQLGEIALHNFCPRCFWIKMKMGFKLPFQIFPGIFNSIDSYTKKISHSFFDKYGRLPKWLEIEGVPIRVPSYSKYQVFIRDVKIQFTGVPDEIIQLPDRSYYIIDYKTAKYTDTQYELKPMYEVQLNGYAYIAEQIGISPVSGLYLVYYEPSTDIELSAIDNFILENGFSMNFSGKVIQVEIDRNRIMDLLERAREIYDYESLPPGRDRCQNCLLIKKILQIYRPV